MITVHEKRLKIGEHEIPLTVLIDGMRRATDMTNTNRRQLHVKLQHKVPLLQESSQ